MKLSLIPALLTAASVAAFAAEPDLSKLPPPAKQSGVTYEKDIKPIFEASCFRCHGEQRARAELRLNSLESALKGSENGKVIIPGDSAKSKLVIATSRIDEEFIMPPPPRDRGNNTNAPAGAPPPPKPLTSEQVGLVRAWIDQGAK